jgi:hypothetical protein
MEDTSTFSDHWVYCTDFWFIMWSFGILCDHLVDFPRFGLLYHESGNPVQNETTAN